MEPKTATTLLVVFIIFLVIGIVMTIYGGYEKYRRMRRERRYFYLFISGIILSVTSLGVCIFAAMKRRAQ